MGKYFGTDGMRGRAGVDLLPVHAYKIGLYLALNAPKKKILLAKDTRLSGDMLEGALRAGICAGGADSYEMGVSTTPSVAFTLIDTEDFDYGIMISASHNPYYDNGIKIIKGDGTKFDDGDIANIESFMDSDMADVSLTKDDKIGRAIDYKIAVDNYKHHLEALFPVEDAKGLRVVLDTANGSASDIAIGVLESRGMIVSPIANKPNGTNINAGVGSTHLEYLSKEVIRQKADIGFAYDGDADRCLGVDEKGEEINGDKLIYVFAKYLRDKGLLNGDKAVATIMSNMGLSRALKDLGIELVTSPVGDRFVKEAMDEGNISVGGEQSGHIILRDYASTGDGILTSILFAIILKSSGLKASELTAPCRMYPQTLINVAVRDKERAINNPALLAEKEKFETKLKEDGRIVLRKSGTENIIRIMVEASDKEKADEIASNLQAVMIKEGLTSK